MAVGLGESPLFERLREDGLLLQHQQNDESTAIVTIARTNAELQTPLFSIRPAVADRMHCCSVGDDCTDRRTTEVIGKEIKDETRGLVRPVAQSGKDVSRLNR
jgi:hypothetical protein